ITSYLASGEFKYVGFTVMPGPSLQQAIPFAKRLKEDYREIIMIWGGYFASNQYEVVLNSGYVDFVVYGPGDHTFPQLINALENHSSIEGIKNLIYPSNDKLIKNQKEDLIDQQTLPPLPYEKLNAFYPIEKYLGKGYLGKRTLAYHSSVGCPFSCSFCAVVPIYNARWKAKPASMVYQDIKYIKDKWHADAIEFHDNNFFVSEKRTVTFSRLIAPENMTWWGEGRIDTIDKYSDSSLRLMREAGCKMIFFGAETGNDAVLKKMNKGGTLCAADMKRFAARIKKFDIIPEYSFVLGTPFPTEEEVMKQIDFDINFIKEIKSINPDTEIIIYVYSPVPVEGSALYSEVLADGFHFPATLEEWISPNWINFDLRKNPLTPWLTPKMIDKIKDFETVLNGCYSTVSDIRLNNIKRKILHTLALPRYLTGIYQRPYELKALQMLWKYRQPEIDGF
ncbi:MAG: B12-binding domain-containing radical SAM protein, partial [Chitinophagaceae bacterium]